MQKRNISWLLLALFSCGDPSERKTPNGFTFYVPRAGNGVVARPNDVVVYDYELRDSRDSVVDNSTRFTTRPAVLIPDSAEMLVEKGPYQMFRMLSKGDSAYFTMSVPAFYEELFASPPPPGVDTTLFFTYTVVVRDILPSQEYLAGQRKAYEEAQAVQLNKDTVAIEAFLKSKGLKAAKTESGIRYVVTRQGKGATPVTNQTVEVHYDGYLIDGTHFDTSHAELARQYGLFDPRNPYQPYPVVIDQGTVIPGWNEALKLLNRGTKATLCIPSALGYGPQSMGNRIGPNSVLIFDIEVVNIR